ncbi:hypothetical protein [Alloacidobacterium sp.]|uniref:hypothetical protein n=1 Tax=Alloacidobacterium sp. TaxID=2951999 RepID=UPI002D447DCC|nr:hypothetical protein [Alloacidobacterium sp.]HYK36418.1 hypothetical protein [Alloacidobacterium sp.]
MAYIALGLFGLVAAVALVYAHIRSRKLLSKDWQELVTSIEPMHMRGLEMVALDHLEPKKNQLRLEPDEIWGLVGGKEGLRRMEHNADLMIALAAYVRNWNHDQSIIVAERIRHDSIQLKRAARRIRWSLHMRRGHLRIPFYVHQAAASYYLMTRRLLSLYETNQYVLYPALAGAL